MAKAIGQLNSAVSNQANTRPGPGMGMSAGSLGRMVYPNAMLVLPALSGGVDGATTDDDDKRVFGKGVAFPIGMPLNDDGDYVADPDEDNRIDVLNLSVDPVPVGEYMYIFKILNTWHVLWVDCGGS
jgi:hypothetical protein